MNYDELSCVVNGDVAICNASSPQIVGRFIQDIPCDTDSIDGLVLAMNNDGYTRMYKIGGDLRLLRLLRRIGCPINAVSSNTRTTWTHSTA